MAVDGLDAREQVEALLAGGGVAGVVEVHHDDVEIASLDGGEDGGGRRGGLDLVALGLEQQAQGLEDVGLIVGDEDAERGISKLLHGWVSWP